MFFALERISQLLVVLYRSLSIEHYNIRSRRTESEADTQSSWNKTVPRMYICFKNVFSFMPHPEETRTFKTEAMKYVSHRLKQGDGGVFCKVS